MSRAPTTAEVLGQMSTDLPEAVCALRLAGDESLEVFVQWMHDLAAERDSLSERLRSACEERASLEVTSEENAKIARLARVFASAKYEWHQLHSLPEPPTREQRLDVHNRHSDGEFALFDAVIPGWRETYHFAWGSEQSARRDAWEAAAKKATKKATKKGQVSP